MLKPGKLFLSRNSICFISADLCTTVAMQQPQLRFFSDFVLSKLQKIQISVACFSLLEKCCNATIYAIARKKKKKDASHPLQRIQQIKWEGGQL